MCIILDKNKIMFMLFCARKNYIWLFVNGVIILEFIKLCSWEKLGLKI